MTLTFKSKREFAEAILKYGKLFGEKGNTVEYSEFNVHLFTFNGIQMDGYWSKYSCVWSTTPPLKDKTLVWCWCFATHGRQVRFYDAKNKSTYDFSGKRNSLTFHNYEPFTGEWPEWAKEAVKTLED